MIRCIQLKLKLRVLTLLCILVFSITCTQKSYSQQNIKLSDNAQISLLTNDPWDEEIYALFGHTAIRVNDPNTGLDVAFNYGVFDFDSPNFIYRFVKGQTDYWISPFRFKDYIYSYRLRGVGVTEQILNLNQEEKQSIFDALVINSLPENRTYRYNYFYDNCSTRPRDIIINNIDGKVEYISNKKKESYRDVLHDHLKNHQWILFGIDLVIGSDADLFITELQKDFLPANLKLSFQSAQIKTSSSAERNLVSDTQTLSLPSVKNEEYKDNLFLSPINVGILLLLVTTSISYLSLIKKNRLIGRLYDTALFCVAGIIGCIIFFLMFFSVHPCTSSNWNIVWLNPILLLFAFIFFIKPRFKYTYYFHLINFVILTLFFLLWYLIPQQLNLAFIPYIVSLWMRSGINIIQNQKDKQL